MHTALNSPRRLLRPFLALLLTPVLCSACGGKEAPKPQVQALITPLRPKGSVVAKVDGQPIYASDLKHQLLTLADPEQALKELVQRELLAKEAIRRGLADEHEITKALRSALAEQLIHQDFGATFKKTDIPAALVERSFKLNLARFQHPEFAEVTHILAMWHRKQTAALQERAALTAQEVYKRAIKRPMDAKAFKAIARDLRSTAAPVKLRVEKFKTPRQGLTAEPFAKAAFALKRSGDVSPVVQTRFGFHVIYLHRRIPAMHKTLADVDGSIREKIFDEARQLSFDRFAKTVERAHGVVIDYQALKRALTVGK
ncbi:MAG: peptidylprolyl isomerase [Deltaproteobacteria bacterium]|nr:peptidylprolyl isomerase [Deltaproteobacteria bacterium]